MDKFQIALYATMASALWGTSFPITKNALESVWNISGWLILNIVSSRMISTWSTTRPDQLCTSKIIRSERQRSIVIKHETNASPMKSPKLMSCLTHWDTDGKGDLSDRWNLQSRALSMIAGQTDPCGCAFGKRKGGAFQTKTDQTADPSRTTITSFQYYSDV